MSKRRITSFGSMATLKVASHTIELLRFVREGRDHIHDSYEHAVCLSGPSEIIIGGDVHDVTVGRVYSVPPGTPHRMRPLTDEPSVWLLWYGEQIAVNAS